MKRKRFTEEQIIAVLRKHEAGAKAADLARKHGVSEATLYNWKVKYGVMDVSDAKRLKALEYKNAKLLADFPGLSISRLRCFKKPWGRGSVTWRRPYDTLRARIRASATSRHIVAGRPALNHGRKAAHALDLIRATKWGKGHCQMRTGRGSDASRGLRGRGPGGAARSAQGADGHRLAGHAADRP